MKRILLLVVIMTFWGCGGDKERSEEVREVKPVKTVPLVRKEIKREVVGNSDILPLNKTAQITKSGGEIVEINYKNGDLVEKGDLILKLYNEEVISRYERAKAQLINMKAQMERTEKFSERESRQAESQALAAYIKTQESSVCISLDYSCIQSELSVNYLFFTVFCCPN